MDFVHPFQVVGQGIEGDILHLLSRGERAYTGREVQRLIESSSMNVTRLALQRLVAQGIVISEPGGGRAILYQLNRDHIAAPHIEALAALRLKLFERLRETIARWQIRPAIAAVFGSVARGEATSESDLDIFLLRPKGCDEDEPLWLNQVNALQEAATSWTGNDARVLEYGETELPRLRREEPVIADIASEGVALAGNLRDLRRAPRSHK